MLMVKEHAPTSAAAPSKCYEMRQTPNSGRGLFATGLIKQNTKILSSPVAGAALHRKHLSLLCQHCFTYTESGPDDPCPIQCKGCTTHYCSLACQTKDLPMHAPHCALLRHVSSSKKLKKEEACHVRLLFRLLSHCHKDPTVLNSVLNMMPDNKSIPGYKKRTVQRQKAATFFVQMLPSLGTGGETKEGSALVQQLRACPSFCSVQATANYLARGPANEFALFDYDEEGCGCGFFPLAALINHSCVPSASVQLENNQMVFYATKDIMAGEEITQSYGNLSGDGRMSRQENLQESWGFVCHCVRCRRDAAKHVAEETTHSIASFDAKHVCPCGGVVVPLVFRGTREGTSCQCNSVNLKSNEGWSRKSSKKKTATVTATTTTTSAPLLLALLALFCCSWQCVDALPAILVVSGITPSTKANPTGDPKFTVTRPFSNRYLSDVFSNPFLMADEWGDPVKILGKPAVDPGPPSVTGKRHVGWHPHRGFDIVSVIKEGRGAHADSMGNIEVVRPGGIQWMRTGSGVEHAEGGGSPVGAAKHGFQLWINLPSHMKMNDPSYGTVQPEHIPQEDNTNKRGGLVRYLAGAYKNSASFPDRKDFSIIDVELPANATQIVSLPLQFEKVIIYAYRGRGKIAGQLVRPQNAAVLTVGAVEVEATAVMEDVEPQEFHFNDLATVELQAGGKGYAVLIFAAVPLAEPIAWRGPIVMNTDREIEEAYRELRSGSFLKKRVGYDYKKKALTK